MDDSSSIPPQASEVPDWGYTGAPGHRRFECVLESEVVGYRVRDESGALVLEHGLRNGRHHGYWRDWESDGSLAFETFYVDGLEHGTARQFCGGRFVGTYTLDHGTGVDLWRDCDGKLSEERHLQDGKLHGFERWWWPDNRTIWEESHFKQSKEHGIFRWWNHRGKLCRGYPRYYVDGQRVTKRQYLKACAGDASLPPFRPEDNEPFRELPPEYLDAEQ